MLTISDISFLSRKTKLSKERTHLLFEEKEDGDLVLQQLGSKRLTKKELLDLCAGPRNKYIYIYIYKQTSG